MVFFARGWQQNAAVAQGLLPRWVVGAYFGFNLLFLMYASVSALGIGLPTGTVLMLYLALIHGLVNGALAVGVLQYRSQLAERRKNDLLTQLSLSQQQVIQERSSREDREQLLAMLAHELKTPLATIQFLLGGRSVDDKAVGNIKKATADMNMVIERSVQMGQFDGGLLATERSTVNVVALLTDLIDRNAEGRFIKLHAPESPSQANPLNELNQLNQHSQFTIETDPNLLRMICSNLIDNALKYRADGSVVWVYLDPPTPACALSLRVENAPGAAGFPDPDLLFNRYYRAPLARGFTGSGLGLYLVKGLAQQLGGEIHYIPTDNTICFHLCLTN